MRTLFKLFWLVAALAAGATLVSRFGRRRKRAAQDTFPGDPISPEDLVPEDLALAEERSTEDMTVPPGLSQVDPEPLSQMTEALDPDATRAAHQNIPEQRERLPVRGKNVP